MKKLLFLIMISLLGLKVHAQTPLSGKWKGVIEIQGQQLTVIFNIEGQPVNYSGTLDIPQQGAKDLPLSQAEQKGDSVLFVFNAGQVTGTFEGMLESETQISGMYQQGPGRFPFKLEKQQSTDAETQIGEGTDLIIPKGDIDIGGTLVVPENTPRPPLVIMISGSGAQNQDSNIFEFKPFAILAEHLKSQGIASFRYDDRQIGKSTGSFANATLDTLASDVDAIILHLQQSDEITPTDIILLGHSQGGVVAGKVASENEEVDQLILMASTGISIKEILRFQVQQALSGGTHSQEDIETEIENREMLMEAIRKGEELEEAKQNYINHYKDMLNNLPDAQKAGIPDIPTFAKRQTDQLVTVYSSPQMQSLLFHQPGEDLKQLKIPALVLFGEKDTQVTEKLNREPIEQALQKAGVDYTVEVIPTANHLFQKANTGMATEYASLEKQFVDGFKAIISEWIHNH
ncbi:MAG: alpha/beta hydrolase [Balneolaceae bacterium]|nr:alpha/beta hydrolase [Balneolaceae bacterium]